MATYLDTYPKSISDGVGLISILSAQESIPWNVLDESVIQDVERTYGVRSGFKTLTAGILTASDSARARILSTLFSHKWTKLWKDFSIEYDPLHAYIVEEEGERNTDNTSKLTEQYGRVVDTTESDTGTVENDSNDSTTDANSVYGFNSLAAVDSDSSIGTSENKSKETRNLSTTNKSINSGQDITDNVRNENGTYKVTKKGNIGYSTPQKLLREDIALWIDPFFSIVFNDIDSFITIMVYEI